MGWGAWRGDGVWGGGGLRGGYVGRCTTVLVCCSVRPSGTVDVQRLAVLLQSMQHAEVHTFFQRGLGVVTGTDNMTK